MNSRNRCGFRPSIWRRHLTGQRAIIGLAAAILAYEIAAPEDQLISHAVDRLLDNTA